MKSTWFHEDDNYDYKIDQMGIHSSPFMSYASSHSSCYLWVKMEVVPMPKELFSKFTT